MKVTIIYPSIRNDHYSKLALASIYNQSHRDFELIDDREGPNANMAINRCLDKARGDLITWCYDDDVLFAEKNEIFAMYANRYPNIDIFYCGHVGIDHKNRFLYLWNAPYFEESLFEHGTLFGTLSVAVRRKSLNGIRFRERYPITGEFVFFYELFKAGCKFLCINVPLVYVRNWKGQNTVEKHEAKKKEHEQIRKEFGSHLYSKCKYQESKFS